ncbi:MAG: hypothetical protein K2O12_01745 [Muribaculaceae bacterium]|nr:hypothetical protein [Muribaculaceae bacterium]
MLNLAGNIFGCLFWGGLSALVLAGLTAFIAKGISGKALNPAVLVILTVCLLWQTILGTGALYAFSYVDEVHSYIQKIEHTSGNIDIDGAADELRRQFQHIPQKIKKITKINSKR